MFQYVAQEWRAGVGFGVRAFLEIGPCGPSRVSTPKTIPRRDSAQTVTHAYAARLGDTPPSANGGKRPLNFQG